MARDMKKICAGTWRDEGIKWFSELLDKGKSYGFFFLKKHMYINFTICHTNNGVISLLLIQLKPQKHISTGP